VFCPCFANDRPQAVDYEESGREPKEQEHGARMRKRERDHVVGKIAKVSDTKHGGPLCVRPYKTDEIKLEEIAHETGEGKAAIVRRMIRFALSDKQERFGANRCRERLDWLIENERQNGRESDTVDERFDGLLERIAGLEGDLKIVTQETSIFLRELYMMSSVSVSTMNILLSRVIQLSMPAGDKKQSVLIADGTMVELIAYAIRDLERCAAFHGIGSDDEGADNLYFAKRIKALQANLASSQPPTPESGQRPK
jgi:hypothetical protein